MKPNYIILTFSIGGIGGGQLYCKNKSIFLKCHNFQPFIFFATLKNDVYLDELKEYKENIVTELLYPPYFFSKKRQQIVLNKIFSKINLDSNTNDYIIESHTVNSSLWGELLAKSLKCKNFIYLLNEKFMESHNKLNFLSFKHHRKELVGITKESLPLLFNNYKVLEEDEKYFFNAACISDTEDIYVKEIEDIKPKEVNIACISRLTKPQVNVAINEIINFCVKHYDKKIQFVLIGASPALIKEKKRLLKRFKKIDNLNAIILDSIYPIPKSLFKKVDVCVAVAGCARICFNEGMVTIVIDTLTNKPGILGYDTASTLYSNGNFNSLCELLEFLFIDNNLETVRNKIEFITLKRDFFIEYNKHLEFINSSAKAQAYYDIEAIKVNGLKERIKKIIINILGISNFEKLLTIYNFRQKIKKDG